ncbi:TRM11 family SAM-dependent methyltransferase [Kribbella sp. C-35]|uniref:TRM11 family SAM-dependent methyltransferase n=1 Tax=Kribbella sp. C-35 TaxID=2789276 RepID=UPI00397C2D07
MVMPCITDHLVLRTIDGAADLLIEELRAMASIHSIRQASVDTVECAIAGSLDELAACALYSTVALRDPGKSLQFGVLGTLPEPVKFRVGVDDPERRREMINATEQRFGWVNRPGDWDVNLVPSADGWIAEFGPLSWTRRFGRSERLPWSTNFVVVEVLVRLAKIHPTHRVLDPFCGTGTILHAVRRQHPTTHLLGLDHNPTALTLATGNSLAAAHSLVTANPLVVGRSPSFVRGTAEVLPVASGCVDRVVANLPFGKQVGSHRANRTLYPAVLDEIHRILTGDGRAVLLTEDKRLLLEAVERRIGLKIVRQRLLRYKGATPTAYVLARTRLPGTARPR